MSRVLVFGLGYVGLPLAVNAAESGHVVTGVDLDCRKIVALQEGSTYVEDVSDDRIRAVTERGAFTARLGWEPSGEQPVGMDFDLAIIAVPTPLRRQEPDLSYVEGAARMIGQVLRPGAAVVLESTTYPGTTEGLLAETLRETSGLVPGDDFHLGFSPERIDPGSDVYTLRNTPKLVSGTTVAGLAVIDAFYRTIVDTTVRVSSPRVAEMAKVFENTQAYVSIALINEVSEICHDMCIDVHEMIEASMTKGHSVSYWTPGPGVGGHCLPIDPLYLAWQTRTSLGRRFRLAELANDINAARPGYVVDRTIEMLGTRGIGIRDARVLVLGVAYKPRVGDLRESPAVEVVTELSGRGAHVTVVDPHVREWDLTDVLELEDLPGQVEQFDAVVITTDHPEFDYVKLGAQAQQVLDCRHSMTPAANVVTL